MKRIWVIILVSALILLVLAGVGAYFYFGIIRTTPVDTTSTSDNGFASMSAEFLDAQGNPITVGTAQSMIAGNAPDLGFMILNLQVKYISGGANDVDLKNVKLLTPNTALSENLVKDGGAGVLLATLPKTQTTLTTFATTGKTCTTAGTSDPNCDTKEVCTGAPLKCWINLTKYESTNVDTPLVESSLNSFKTKVQAERYDALGNIVTVDSGATLIGFFYDLRAPICSDGTVYLTCSAVTKPKFCMNTTAGGKPTLVNKALGMDGLVGGTGANADCGCPSGQHASGDNCVADTCTDTALTPVNTCHTYFTTLISHADANQRWCASAGSALTENCKGPDGIAGNGDDCGCATDYNAGAGTCQATGLCSYPTYTGGISGCIPDCLGKGICTACDGCTPAGNCP